MVQNKKVILNLGCGNNIEEGMINVDRVKRKGVGEVVDLSKYPWKWKDESVDEIHSANWLEHMDNTMQVIRECHRILKPNGLLHLIIPHATSVTSLGHLEHSGRLYTTCSFSFFTHLFKQESLRINWFRRGYSNMWIISWLIDWLINLSHGAFERGWCYWVGGADEMEYRGRKR